MANQQVLTFAIKAVDDSEKALREVEKNLGNVREEADKAARAAGGFGEKLHATAEAGGDAEQALRGVNDLSGVLADQFGVSLGPIGGYTQALMDVGGGVEALLKGAPAFIASLGTMTAATWAHVTALVAEAAAFVAANAPLILAVAAIAAVSAGVVLLVTHWDTITAKVPILGQAFDTVQGTLSAFTGWITGTLVPILKDPIEALQAVKDWATSNWPIVATILSGPFAPIVLLATDAFGVRSALTGAIQGALDWVKGNWPEIATVISGPFAPLVILATDGFGIRSAMVDAFTGLIDDLVGLVQSMTDAGKQLGGALKDGIVEGLGAIVDKATEIGGDIKDALKTAWNLAIQFADDNFKLHIPGLSVAGKTIIPDVDWNPDLSFLKLAAGGIVTRPTFALIGEAGPEAVIPLNRAGGGLGVVNHYHINIQGSVWSLDDLAYELNRRGLMA